MIGKQKNLFSPTAHSLAKLHNQWTHQFDNQYAHYTKMEASVMDTYVHIYII